MESRFLLFGTNIPIALNAGFCSGSAFAAAGAFAATFSVTAVAAGSAGGRTGLLSDMMCCGWLPSEQWLPQKVPLPWTRERTKSRAGRNRFPLPAEAEAVSFQMSTDQGTTKDTDDISFTSIYQQHYRLENDHCRTSWI